MNPRDAIKQTLGESACSRAQGADGMGTQTVCLENSVGVRGEQILEVFAMRPWWQRMIGHSPLHQFFWTPRGIMANARDAFSDSAVSQQKAGQEFRELFPGTGLERNGNGRVHYVATLAHAKVIGDVTLAARFDDVVLGDLQMLQGVEKPADHWVVKRRRFRRPRRLAGTAVLLAAAGGSNYYHWLFDSLPRLHLLELAGFDLRDADWFLLNQFCHAFHAHSLNELGIPANKRRPCSKEELLEVERLVLPSMPGPPLTCAPWACDFLRRKFLSKEPGSDRKIYVTRRHARGRRLANEDEIVSLLQPRGFEVVCLEQMTFREQVELFASARVVVGVHGAGMANLVFARAGSSVLEIFSPAFHEVCYRNLATTLKLNYRSMTGTVGPRRVKARSPELADIKVEPAEFQRQLEALGV